MNFAPQPFGFLDPTAVGLQRNFYLPAGSTSLVPKQLDRIGFGLPEQRAEDEARRARLAAAAVLSANKKLAETLAGESVETLQDLAAGRGGFSRAGVLFATSEVPFNDLQAGAAAQLVLINTPEPQTPLPAPPVGQLPTQATEPARVEPINDAGIRNRDAHTGIDQELVHERADP